MNFIEKILLKSETEKKFTRKKWIAVLLFFVPAIMQEFFLIDKNILKIFTWLVIVNIVYVFLEPLFLRNKKLNLNFKNTKLYKALEKKDYLEDFLKTIDLEIESKNAIKYYNKTDSVGLVMTETWFIYITAYNPVVGKTSEINKIGGGDKLDKGDALLVEFNDGKLSFLQSIDYFDVEKEIKNKYPKIIMDYNIFDDK